MEAYHPPKPELTGYWEGALVDRSSVQIVRLTIEDVGGSLEGEADIREMGWIGMRGPVERNGDTVRVAVLGNGPMLFDRATAELRGSVTFRGGRTPTIHLKQVLKPAQKTHRIEEVRFDVGDVTMAGSMVLPEGAGPHPAVVFIAGRGYGQRREHLADAVRLARRGVAAFVFDGRGTGESGGDRAATTDLDRYADAQAAFQLVRARPDVRKDHVGLYTNSAGAWIGPRIASETGKVAFLIMIVGPAESLADQQGHVVEYNMRWNGSGFSEDDYRAAFEYQKSLVEMSARGASWDEIAQAVERARSAPWKDFVDLPDDMNNSELDYYRRRPTFDAVPYLRTLTIPLLALYGETDVVVPPQANVPKLERYLSEAGNRDFKIVVFPNAGHGLTTPAAEMAPGGEWPEAHYHWSRRAPGMYETVLEWLLPRVTASDEREAVAAAVNDYVEALYSVEPERIERSVHPDLRKFGFSRGAADGSYRGRPMTYQQLHDLAAKWNVDNRRQIDAATPRRVEVLDVLDQTATAKLTAAWGVDYMHLAKIDGRWQIMNVLWQSHPR